MHLLQQLPTIEGAPWWLILLVFAVMPALWKVATHILDRVDERRRKREAAQEVRRQETLEAFKQKDDRIRELYDRLLTDGIESREALATAAKTLEGFVEKENRLELNQKRIEANQRSMMDVLVRIENHVRKLDAA